MPASPAVVDAAVSQVRSEFLPIADADAVSLARIARTHTAGLSDVSRLPDLARFLDTHLVLCYWNGHEWYDVHPLIYREVMGQADAATARLDSTADGNSTSFERERRPTGPQR